MFKQNVVSFENSIQLPFQIKLLSYLSQLRRGHLLPNSESTDRLHLMYHQNRKKVLQAEINKLFKYKELYITQAHSNKIEIINKNGNLFITFISTVLTYLMVRITIKRP